MHSDYYDLRRPESGDPVKLKSAAFYQACIDGAAASKKGDLGEGYMHGRVLRRAPPAGARAVSCSCAQARS